MSSRRSLKILVFLLICVWGCKSTPPRPANVPASAISVNGSFIECSVDEAARANRCAVYNASSGEIQVSGLFHLSGAGREARKNELRYVAFEGTRIWLEDARALDPVVLFEYAVPGMENQLQALAGKDAVNCGRVTLAETPHSASECALKTFAEKRPFYVSYDQRYAPGYTGGYAGDATGKLYFFEYSKAGWRGRPLHRGMQISDDYRMVFGPCPQPSKLIKDISGELACVGPLRDLGPIIDR